MGLKEIGLRVHNVITILGSIDNIVGEGGGVVWPLNEHKSLHFDNEWGMHLSSQNYEKVATTLIWIF